MSRILPLSPETISQIHSSKQITSLQGVVLSLVENSLDAGSNRIEITIDSRRGGCTVEDNGLGIAPGEFLENGGLARMYHTSKHTSSTSDELHGTTGTFIASLSALSLMSITSRHYEHDQHATLTIHLGKIVARQLPAPSSHDISPSSPHGARVVVRDLFGNMPVRVKQRALAAHESRESDKAWFELKLGLVALILSWSTPCVIRLRDSGNENRVLHLSGVHPSLNVALTKKSLNRLSGKTTKFDLKDVIPVLSQAGIIAPDSRGKWIPISASTSKLSVKGSICLDPSPTKQCQFISIGVTPCSIASGNNDLYDAINRIFSNSSFGTVDDDSEVDETEKDRRKRDRRFKSNGYTQKQLHGRKGVDRWPMFVIQIKYVDKQDRIAGLERMSDSTVKGIVDILEATTTQWLTSNHFRPRKPRSRKIEDDLPPANSVLRAVSGMREIRTPEAMQNDTLQSATTSKKRKYAHVAAGNLNLEENSQRDMHSPSDYFSSWTRIKSGRSAFYDEIWQGKKPATAPAGQSATRSLDIETRPPNVFKLPILEAGELSRSKPAPENAVTNHLVSEIVSDPQKDIGALGEDYGSFDEEAAIDTISDVDQMNPCNALLDPARDIEVRHAASEHPITSDAIIDWTEPVTKQKFKVNARTGVLLPSRLRTAVSHAGAETGMEKVPRDAAAIDTSTSSTGNPLILTKRRSSLEKTESNWLPGFLQAWNNPVFSLQNEQRIPVASNVEQDRALLHATSGTCSHGTRSDMFTQFGVPMTGNLTKAAMKKAKVIKQVDKKYIMCKAPKSGLDEGGEVLILIDQHAASERVILEALLTELCAPLKSAANASCPRADTVRLDRALRFQISEAEEQLFHLHSQHFERWGILYELSNKNETLSASQVRAPKREYIIAVHNLPSAIAERCTLSPKLLIELLRTEIWSLAESSKKPSSHRDDHDDADSLNAEHDWLKRIGSCPKGLLDMLNSRACRSAIMFNDDLSIEQCRLLLSELSTCAFPFMCAHGRVSIVPLVDSNSVFEDRIGSPLSGIESGAGRGFAEAFREWKGADRQSRDRIKIHS